MADVLIKGLEMPKSCFYCPFRERVNANPYDYVCMALNKEFEETFSLIAGTRHKDCPLVPVPTHGRLIDADELLKSKGDCYDHEGHLLYAVGTGDIMLAPTVIEASGDGEQNG